MVINFVFFILFLVFFSLNGKLLSSWYLISTNKNFDLFEVNNIVISLLFFGLLGLLFNFFIPMSSIIIKIALLISTLISFYKFKNQILLSIKNNILIIFFLSIVCYYMEAGHDAALYHLPHQNFIREYKIIFGLFNLHERFGLTSIYGNIASFFWIKKNLLLLTYLQGIFYFLLFKDIQDRLLSKNSLNNLLGISTLIFVPVWLRYANPSFGLVDFPTGILFYLSFVKGIEILIFKNDINNNLKCFLISSALLFCFKVSYLLFSVYVIYVLIFSLKFNLINFKTLVKFLYLPLILVCFWLLRTFVNTSCLIFPLYETCFETSWSNRFLVLRTFGEITEYGKIYISYLNFQNLKNVINLDYLFFSIFFLFLFILVNLKIKNFFKIKYSNLIKFYLSALIFFNILILFNVEVITGYSTLIKSEINSNQILGRKIFFKEIILILFTIFSSFTVPSLLFFQDNKIKSIKLKKINYLPLTFLVIFFLIWFYFSANPRFSIGYLAAIPMSLVLLFAYYVISSSFELNKRYLSIFFIIYLALSVNILVKKNFLVENIYSFPSKVITEIDIIKRKKFGVRPMNYCNYISESNLCWIEKDCYFIEKDATIDNLKFNYLLIKEIVDRRHPQCVIK